jgi:3-hydroxybutyryl-CoA dehydrogenase
MEQIAIIGAGTMGHGIAQVAAMAGYRVRWFDPHAGALASGLQKIEANLLKTVELGKLADASAVLERIACCASLADAASHADLVVEAVPERLELKQSLFLELEDLTRTDCVLATNTSSLSIARIAAPLRHPHRVIGTHFFNPVHRMPLLEVVTSEHTAPEVTTAMRAWGEKLGKDVIVVRDAPGFATSRLGVCLGMEAIRMVEQGVASPEDIDKAMVLGYRHPVGPLRLTDMVGLDVRMAIGAYLAHELKNPAFEPPELLRRLVAEGRMGKKSGEGFYRWP